MGCLRDFFLAVVLGTYFAVMKVASLEVVHRLVVLSMAGVVGAVEGCRLSLSLSLSLSVCMCIVDDMMIVQTQGVHAYHLVFGGLLQCGGERANS